MAVFKCKMCGGALEVNNETVATCSYCGTQQTLPRLDDEKRAQLYDRANYFRRENEFDKAMGIYEMILGDEKTDSEAYWGIVLCRYGIEYVEDPRSHRRIPTVNRAQFTSIFDDADYKKALEYSDSLQKGIYEAEATVIDKIQKGILAVSSKEEPFDIFICYKETDNQGNRTQDSVYAQDIYNALVKEGYKVFFSRITLEDKLGSAYEPYIFAALNSAKVMLVVGTSKDNFNAVWVKNEWSRFISLIKAGKEKTLIPLYKDMSPYEMPEEFQYLQSQDMGKIGYIQDVVHGVKKLVEVNITTIKETVVVNSEVNSNVTALLKRGFMALEDREWGKADSFFEQALNQNAELAQAYLGKLLAELHVSRLESLRDLERPFNERNSYQKTLRFADGSLKNTLLDYIKYIEERNENARLEGIYNQAKNYMNSARTETEYLQAAAAFNSIYTFKDAGILREECSRRAELSRKSSVYNGAKTLMMRNDEASYSKAASMFESLGEYMDSTLLAEDCVKKAEITRNNSVLEAAKTLMKQDKISSYDKAINLLETIVGWGDADETKTICKEKKLLLEKQIQDDKFVFRSFVIITIIVGLMIFFLVLNTNLNKKKSNDTTLSSATETTTSTADEVEDGYIYSVSAGRNHTVALITNGKVIANVYKNDENGYFFYYGQNAVNHWSDIIAISAGEEFTLGLKSDGSVVSVGSNAYGECDIDDWTDIIAVSAGDGYSVGLRANCTVVAKGYNAFGECDVDKWTNIVDVSAYCHTVGLKSDGTVVAVGLNLDGQCDVSNWTDIVGISAGASHTVGLKSNGTVVAVGNNDYGQCDVSNWTDIVAISAGNSYTVGLKSDGTVIAVGNNDMGQCDVGEWTDVVAIDAGDSHTVGLKVDGTVVAVGYNMYGQCDVSDWTGIKLPNEQ